MPASHGFAMVECSLVCIEWKDRRRCLAKADSISGRLLVSTLLDKPAVPPGRSHCWASQQWHPASFNFMDHDMRVAGSDALVGTVDEQIEVLQHDRAEQCSLPIRLHDFRQRAI